MRKTEQDRTDRYGEQEDSLISYETNFEGKEVVFKLSSYYKGVELFVDNQKIELTTKEEDWIQKHLIKRGLRRF